MIKKHMQNPKVALITGAARRVGAEIARILHQNGMNVVLHYLQSEQEATRLCRALNKQRPHSAVTLKADLSDTTQIKPLIKSAANAWGRLDVLVNNASCYFKTVVDEITPEAWNKLIDTNLKAPVFLAQAAVPYLKKTKGSIINIVDIHAQRPMLNYPIYSISKAGLSMATKSLARELGSFGISVNAVSPGHVAWPEGKNAYSSHEKKEFIAQAALKRPGSSLAIAKAVLFLATSADYITGQDIAVDGGRSLFL